MLPNKTYTPDELLRMAWRRKWLVVIPAVVVSIGTIAWSFSLPNRYQSTTSILIVPQRVPQDYVRSTVTTGIGERLQMISQQILSRTRLERIIQDFDLYAEERETMIMEDVIEQMRLDISGPTLSIARRGEGSGSFQVGYESSDPRTAMLVTERIASLFIKENLEDRELLADSTSEFLEAQLQEARRRLVEREGELEAFRRQNSGRLPSQVQANLQLMQSAEAQLHAQIEAANRDRDRLAILQRAAAEPAAAASTPADVGGVSEGPVSEQLAVARASLERLELRFKPDHPDIARARRIVAELQAQADVEALSEPLSPVAIRRAPTPEERNARVREAEIRTEIEAIERRLVARGREEQRLERMIGEHRSRVEAAPGLESDLTDLMRDYTTLQDAYTGMLRKSEESKISLNLERRQIGEQFKILENARLPERPTSPDRLRINLLGSFAGLALGLLLVGFVEYRDTTLKTDEDVVTSLTLPVLAVIPAMVTAVDRARRRRRRLVTVAVSLVAAACAAGAAVWRLQLLEALFR